MLNIRMPMPNTTALSRAPQSVLIGVRSAFRVESAFLCVCVCVFANQGVHVAELLIFTRAREDENDIVKLLRLSIHELAVYVYITRTTHTRKHIIYSLIMKTTTLAHDPHRVCKYKVCCWWWRRRQYTSSRVLGITYTTFHSINETHSQIRSYVHDQQNYACLFVRVMLSGPHNSFTRTLVPFGLVPWCDDDDDHRDDGERAPTFRLALFMHRQLKSECTPQSKPTRLANRSSTHSSAMGFYRFLTSKWKFQVSTINYKICPQSCPLCYQ